MAQLDPSLTERQQYWLKHIRACDAAGKPSVEYARENGIEVSALYSARKALAEKGALPKLPRFLKATVVDGPGSAQRHFQLPNGATVGFSREVKRSSLEKARFHWPRKSVDELVTLTSQQLNWPRSTKKTPRQRDRQPRGSRTVYFWVY